MLPLLSSPAPHETFNVLENTKTSWANDGTNFFLSTEFDNHDTADLYNYREAVLGGYNTADFIPPQHLPWRSADGSSLVICTDTRFILGLSFGLIGEISLYYPDRYQPTGGAGESRPSYLLKGAHSHLDARVLLLTSLCTLIL